jgi:class 3 adenylate cyclase/pimeloyl-ACP methyl ester carboxylesterase
MIVGRDGLGRIGDDLGEERLLVMTARRLAVIVAADVVGFSALMESDEEGTLARLKSIAREVIFPKVRHHHGRVVKTTGDGFLAEFASPVEAVRGALAIQKEMTVRMADTPPDEQIRLRIGLTLGDVIVEDNGDVYGEDVNVAARLQALAAPGRVLVSGKVFDEVENKIDCAFEDRGKHHVKNMVRPVRVYEAVSGGEAIRAGRVGPAKIKQEISFCRAPDGVRLAWAKVGQGPPLVKAANWMNHLELDWESPVWHHLLEGLSRQNTLIRYDARGNGLSDWAVNEVSLDAWVSDLETVVNAAGVGRFPLFGMSQGCAVSVAYAVRHPDRVSKLVLYGGFAVGGHKRSPEERERRDAMETLIRLGWGSDDPSFRQLFTFRFIPDATKDEVASWNELQRRTASPECAARYFHAVGDLDVRELLPQVRAPTLVMHVRDDLMCPVEAGRAMAAEIPGARFVEFPGRNHLLRDREPACERFFEELRLFLAE